MPPDDLTDSGDSANLVANARRQLALFDEQVKQAEEHSLGFARLALTNLFILNGGGLGAMPAFAAFLPHADGAGAAAFASLLPAAIAFIVGLLATMASTVLAYAGFDARRAGLAKSRSVALGELERLAASGDNEAQLDRASRIGVDEVRILLERADARRLAVLAICGVLVSVIAFVAGCLLALAALSP